jgi:hypothetical protein
MRSFVILLVRSRRGVICCVVSGGRGADAAAQYGDSRGRGICGSSSHSADVSELVVASAAELPPAATNLGR